MDIIVNLNKPRDITSQEAVTKAKKILQVKKAGHAGTLDPAATGLLIICVNRATRLAPYFSDLDKGYKAVMKLGEATDTQDACGRVIEKSNSVDIGKTLIENTLISFKGKSLQQPPMFSALKHKGKPLYQLARKGIEVERKPREVTIHHMELLDIDSPYVSFKVVCSKGTYIRTLCDDIGKKLGVGAHLYELERTAIGQFRIEDSLTFEDLKSAAQGELREKGIYTMDNALSWLPEFKIEESSVKAVIHGNPVKISGIQLSDDIRGSAGIRIKSPDGDLLAIGSYSAVKNEIKMDVVFA